MVITRFAPSPNGPLHLGHAYAAIIAHDRARADGGCCRLRIEDIDGARSRADLIEGIIADLAWLGLAFDGQVIMQSTRVDQHQQAADQLRAMGLLYPCHCSRADIAAAATQMGPDGPVYPGTCRNRDVDEMGASWRLDVGKALTSIGAITGPLGWHDELAGPQIATPQIFGDVVLVRRDAPSSYHLAATLDDAADGVTHVVRGADLFAATHIHRLLQALLGLPQPVWRHHPLVLGADGRKLAKRRGSPSLADLRLAGEDGFALATALRKSRFPSGISVGNGPYEGA